MNARSRIVAVALTATVPFALAACGNADATHAKASIKANILTSMKSADGSTQLTDAQAGCFSGKVVDKVGLKQLQADKVIDSKNNVVPNALDNTKLSQADATKFADAIITCTDNGAPFVAAIKKALDQGQSAATATCMGSKLTTDVMMKFMVAGFSGDGSATTVLENAVAPCMASGN